MNPRLLLAAALLAATALAGPIACRMPGADPAAQVTPGTGIGIALASLDKTVKPGDDFYGYANGGWMKTAEIPADRSSIGGFFIADQATEKNLETLIGEIVKSEPEAGSDAARVKAYYAAFLDTAAIDAAGMAPIEPELDAIAAIADKTALASAIGATIRADVDPLNYTDFETENLFGVFVTQALAGGEVMPYILQGGLGMPQRLGPRG